MRILLQVFVAALVFATPFTAACVLQGGPRTPAGAPSALPSRHLPGGVRPLAYALELEVDPRAERFSGRVRIVVELTAETRELWLHGQRLQVTDAHAEVGRSRVLATYSQRSDEGVALLRFAAPLPRGRAVLELAYDAPFDRQLKGLYRVDVDGAAYVFSQHEPISARLTFPSFDEPRWKTPFDLSLLVPRGLVAASNTEIVEEQALADGRVRVRFARTRPLPTYLVAFAVGPFDVVAAEPVPPNALRPAPLPLRGLAVKGRGQLLTRSLGEAREQLPRFEGYFGSAYPFSKLDLVAVPDFGAGAMENAGLITFRDVLLLLDPVAASEGQKRSADYVMAHELAHQWVGNLVTMHDWQDLWLNEAFATWIGYRVLAEVHPEHAPDRSQLHAVLSAMQADSRESARMIRQPIESTHDILNVFDGITYDKGGAVLTMFERYLGREVFQRGVQRYLATHAYGSATTDDFLGALSASAGRDVATPFSSFLSQAGVPLVSAALVCDPSSTPRARVELSQSRYLPLGSRGRPTGTWQVPVCLRYGGAGETHEACTLLAEPKASLGLAGDCPEWLLPNADAAGYYRFSLPPEQLARLLDRAFRQLSARERVIVADALEAAWDSGALDAETLLGALPRLAADEVRMVATAPADLLRRMRDEMVTDAERPQLEARVRSLYAPLVARLGLRERAGEDGDTKLLRAEALSLLAEVGRDPGLRAELSRLGRQHLERGGGENALAETAPVSMNLADLALRVLAEDGDDAVFEELYARFTKERDPAERSRLLQALASVRDARSSRALALTEDPALRVNEVLVPLRVQLGDPRTRDAAWVFLETHWPKLEARLSAGTLGATPWLATAFCSEAMGERVQRFFAPKIDKLTGGPRALAGAVETLSLCAATVKVQQLGVRAAFAR